jgi:hypothetical protein
LQWRGYGWKNPAFNPRQGKIFSGLQKVWCQPSQPSIRRSWGALYLRIKCLGVTLTTHLHLVLRIWIGEDMPLLPHMPTRRVERELYLQLLRKLGRHRGLLKVLGSWNIEMSHSTACDRVKICGVLHPRSHFALRKTRSDTSRPFNHEKSDALVAQQFPAPHSIYITQILRYLNVTDSVWSVVKWRSWVKCIIIDLLLCSCM